MGIITRLVVSITLIGLVTSAISKTETSDLDCMFLGYPDLEYDGFDRTEVLTEKNFNKTVFAEDAKSVVFFNDVEDDDAELDQYEVIMLKLFIFQVE